MQQPRDQRFRNLFSDHQTTYKTNFRWPKVEKHTVKIEPKPNQKTVTIQKNYLTKDVQTMTTPLEKISFDLLLAPKPVTRTNPHDIQKPVYRKKIDEGLLEARRTRPRLLMTPQVCIDDMTDASAQQFLIDATYISTATRTAQEAVAVAQKARKPAARAPLRERPAPSKPIFLPPLRQSLVPPEWRMETVEWDGKQLRTFADPDVIFWKNNDIYKSCVACKETAQAMQLRKMSEKV